MVVNQLVENLNTLKIGFETLLAKCILHCTSIFWTVMVEINHLRNNFKVHMTGEDIKESRISSINLYPLMVEI